MKRKYKITEKGKKDLIGEVKIPGKDHLEAQQKFKHNVVVPKKHKPPKYKEKFDTSLDD